MRSQDVGEEADEQSGPPAAARTELAARGSQLRCLTFDGGRPVIAGAGEYISPDTDFAFLHLDNSLLFADGLESGSRFFWSGSTP